MFIRRRNCSSNLGRHKNRKHNGKGRRLHRVAGGSHAQLTCARSSAYKSNPPRRKTGCSEMLLHLPICPTWRLFGQEVHYRSKGRVHASRSVSATPFSRGFADSRTIRQGSRKRSLRLRPSSSSSPIRASHESSVGYGAFDDMGAAQIRLSAGSDHNGVTVPRAATAIRMLLNGIKVDGISLR